MHKHTSIDKSQQTKDKKTDKRQEELKRKFLKYIKARTRRKVPTRNPQPQPYDKYRKQIAEIENADEDASDLMIHRLGEEFIKAAERGNAGKLQVFIEEGFPVNYQDPYTGLTALHFIAASQARRALRALLETGECDFLLRDKKGRLASELAYLYGGDVAVARLLGNKERKQAAEKGITLTRRPRPE